MLEHPRSHHYGFAHRELPAAAFRIGPAFITGVRDGRIALAKAWRLYGEQLPEAERLPADGLAAEVQTVGPHQVAVVTLPPPEGPTEAHFVAVAMAGDLRFFTLEAARSPIGGEWYTVLGEWTSNHSHVNRGAGPQADKDAFVAAVVTHLQPLPR
jgi:hypothetical protein